MMERMNKVRTNHFGQEIINFTEQSEINKLRMRKNFISSMLNKTQKIQILKKKKILEIQIDKLILSEEEKKFSIKNINNEQEAENIFQMLTQKQNLNILKLAIVSLRNYFLEDRPKDEKHIVKNEIINKLYGYFLNSNDFSIKYEIYWVFINAIEDNSYLVCLLEDEYFIKVIEEDWEFENQYFLEAICLLLREFLKFSNYFAMNISKFNFLNVIINYLTIPNGKIINLDTAEDTIKIINHIVKSCSITDLSKDQIIKIFGIISDNYETFENTKVFMNICYILYYITSQKQDDLLNLIISKEKFLEKILNFPIDITKPRDTLFIDIIANLMMGEDNIIEFLLNKDVIVLLLKIYKDKDCSVLYKESILSCLNNLANGSSEHILAFLQTDFYEILMKNLLNPKEEEIQRKTLSIINNCISIYNYNISVKLIETGLIENLYDIFDPKDKNYERIYILLKILYSIFQVGNYSFQDNEYLLIKAEKNEYLNLFIKLGGIDKLGEVQLICNETIYKTSCELINEYFECEEEI